MNIFYRKTLLILFINIPLISEGKPKIIPVTEQIKGYPPIVTKASVEILDFPDLGSGNPEIFQTPYFKVYNNSNEIIRYPAWGSIVKLNLDLKNNYLDLDGDKYSNAHDIKWFMLNEMTSAHSSNYKNPTTNSKEFIDNYIEFDLKHLLEGKTKLSIPKEAIGKKIGLSISPKSETGYPIENKDIFINDISSVFGQKIETDKDTNSISITNQTFNDEKYIGEYVLDKPIFKELYYDRAIINSLDIGKISYQYAPSNVCLDNNPESIKICKEGNFSHFLYRNAMEWKCFSNSDPTLTNKIINGHGKKTPHTNHIDFPHLESEKIDLLFPKDSLYYLNSQKGLSCIFVAKNGAGITNNKDIKYFNTNNFDTNTSTTKKSPIYPTAIIKDFSFKTFSRKTSGTSTPVPVDETPIFSVGVPIYFTYNLKAAQFPDPSKDLYFPGDRFSDLNDDGMEHDLKQFDKYAMLTYTVYRLPTSFFLDKDLSSQEKINELAEKMLLPSNNESIAVKRTLVPANFEWGKWDSYSSFYVPKTNDIGFILLVVLQIAPSDFRLWGTYEGQGLEKYYVAFTPPIVASIAK